MLAPLIIRGVGFTGMTKPRDEGTG
jgi:hypothetical protein